MRRDQVAWGTDDRPPSLEGYLSGRYFERLTLDDGDRQRESRDEVADDVVDLFRPILARAIVSRSHVPLPDIVFPPATITATVGPGRALLITVWGPPTEGRQGPAPFVTMGVAPTPLASAELWPLIASGGGEEQIPQLASPAAPWCAVKVYDTAALWPEAMSWLGDFERCFAWAWIDGGSP